MYITCCSVWFPACSTLPLDTGTQPFVFYSHSGTSAYWQHASVAFHWLEATHSHESRSHLCLHIHRGLSVQHPFHSAILIFFPLCSKDFPACSSSVIESDEALRGCTEPFCVSGFISVFKEDIKFILCQRISTGRPTCSGFYFRQVEEDFAFSVSIHADVLYVRSVEVLSWCVNMKRSGPNRLNPCAPLF